MRRHVLLATLAAVLLVLAACGGPPTAEEGGTAAEGGTEAAAGDSAAVDKVLAEVEGLSGQERIDKLAKLAAEEGEDLALYTSMTNDLVDAVSEGFEDEFDIGVSVYRASSETVLQRLIEENSAGFAGADIVETNGPELFALTEEDVLAPYDAAARENLVEGSSYDTWTATRFNNFIISWNTQAVPEGEHPKTWEDLADPKWDGRMGVELSDVDWYKTLYEYWVNDVGKSEEEVDQLFRDIVGGAVAVSGHSVSGELLAAGEFDVFASNYSYLVEELVREDAPVAWEPPVEPIISRPNGVALMKTAPHPATAMLFIEWLLSDGQEVLREFGLDPARQDLITSGEAEVIFVDLESLQQNLQEWTDRYEQLLRDTEQIEG